MRRSRILRSLPVRETLAGVAMRPRLWPAAGRALVRMVPRRWWRRAPFLPLPSVDYLRFRLLTAAGYEDCASISAAEVIQWLEWCHRWPAAAKVKAVGEYAK